MHKSQIIQKKRSSSGVHKDQFVYLTIKSRTAFNPKKDEIKCVLLVKTAKTIIYQSKTITIKLDKKDNLIPVCEKASKQVYLAEAFFFDAVYGHDKIVQIPLW